MLVVLTLCGGNYFISCKQVLYCSLMKQPLIPITWETGQTPQQMWILEKGEKTLETYFPLSPGYSMVTVQIVPGMHLVIFIRILEKDNVCY